MTKPFTAEDLMKIQTVGQLRVSADGSGVAFEVKENDLASDEAKSNLWWARVDAPGNAKVFTACGKASSPSWAHDGKRLAFISGRSSKPQIYIIERDGGEALPQKTECKPSGVLKWSADDRYLAFLAPVDIVLEAERYAGEPEELWRKAAEELASRAKGDKKDDKAKTTPARVINEFDYRADGRGFIYESYMQLFVLDFQDGTCRQLTHSKERINDFAWSSDCELIYIAEEIKQEEFCKHSAFYRIAIDGSQPVRCLNFAGQARGLQFAPKGSGLLFIASRVELPMGAAPSEIWFWDGESAPHSLTEALDRNCRMISWGPEGATVYYLKEDRGRVLLCVMPFVNGEAGAEEVVHLEGEGTVENFAISSNGVVVYTYSDVDKPPQVYLSYNGQCRCLSELNAAYLDSGLFQPAETLQYIGPDGWEVEGWIMKPATYEAGKPVPTVVSVHGGPTGSYLRSFVPSFQMLVSSGFAVLYVNPRGSTGYGINFTKGVIADWGGKDFGDIMAGVDKVVEMKIADPDRLGLMGWSYGGYMTCWSITQTDRFKAAIGGANISNIYTLYGNSDIGAAYDEALMGGPAFDLEELYMDRSAIRHVRKVVTPVLLLHGEADIRCPVDQTEQFYTALKRLGKEAVAVRYPGQYHGLVKPSYAFDRWLRTDAWFKHYLIG